MASDWKAAPSCVPTSGKGTANALARTTVSSLSTSSDQPAATPLSGAVEKLIALAAVAMSGTVWGAPGPADSVVVHSKDGREASTGTAEVPRFTGRETDA